MKPSKKPKGERMPTDLLRLGDRVKRSNLSASDKLHALSVFYQYIAYTAKPSPKRKAIR